jgi:hypothetical protein
MAAVFTKAWPAAKLTDEQRTAKETITDFMIVPFENAPQRERFD